MTSPIYSQLDRAILRVLASATFPRTPEQIWMAIEDELAGLVGTAEVQARCVLMMDAGRVSCTGRAFTISRGGRYDIR